MLVLRIKIEYEYLVNNIPDNHEYESKLYILNLAWIEKRKAI